MPKISGRVDNAMKIGHGFNSFTQTVCLQDAVTLKSRPQKLPYPCRITYSYRFITEASDVIRALGISPASYIKSGFLDTGDSLDPKKIKESDLNLLVHVHVIAETHRAESKDIEFNIVEGVEPANFTEIYGDTFILGYTWGGDFVSVISMDLYDKTHISDVRAQLEACFGAVQTRDSDGAPTVTISEPMKTSIFVNWTCGARSQTPRSGWDINSILRTVAQFPDLCATSPEKVSPILVKYTTLPSFIKIANTYKTISYDHVSLYCDRILKDFIEYQIHLQTLDLIYLEVGHFVETEELGAYDANVAGLYSAQQDIYKQMEAITKNIDAIRINPSFPLESLRNEDRYINPRIFATRLPTRIKPSLLPANSTNKPTSILRPVPVDPQEWQWTRAPNMDSPGNDVERVGVGEATPEDIMRQVIKWEEEHPGQYIKAFNTAGWMKSKLIGTSKLSKGSTSDLFVRTLIDDKWTFSPRVSFTTGEGPSLAGVVLSADVFDIVDILRMCTSTKQDVKMINWNGYIRLTPQALSSYPGQLPFQGTWTRK